MAITAKFEADFQQFVQEAEKANGSLSKIEGTSKSVESALEDLKHGAEDLVGAFGIAFSVSAALEFLTTITEAAHSLKILSAQTQINVEDLQVLGAATREWGVDSEQLGRAIFQLGRRISGGDASVVSGLALMGLSLEDVKNKHGEELFLMVERAAGELHGTLRDTAMADLYGARLGSSLGALSTGIDEAMKRAREMNTIMSTEAVKAAAEYADAIERAKTNIAAMATELIGPLAKGFNVVSEAANKAGVIATFWAMMKDGAGSSGPLAQWALGTDNLATLLDKLNQKTAENTKGTSDNNEQHKQVNLALTEEEQHQRFIATLEANAAVALSAQQLENLGHLKEIGQLNAKNAEGIGVNAAQFAQYREDVDAAVRSEKALEEQSKRLEELAAHMFNVTLQQGKTVLKELRDEEDKRFQAGIANMIAELAAHKELNAMYGLDAAGALKVTGAAEELRKKLETLNAARELGLDVSQREALAEAQYTKALYDEAVATDAVATKTEDVAKATERATGFMDGFRGSLNLTGTSLSELNKQLDYMYSQLAGNNIGTPHPGAISPGFVQPPAGSGFIGRDSGGPVSAGQSYYVGTGAQPELFTPSTSGFMTPAGGSVTVHNYINIVDTEANLARRVGDQVLRSVMSVSKIGAH